jgi:signal peptidase I
MSSRRKVAKLKLLAQKEIDRTHRTLEYRPETFDHGARAEVGDAEKALLTAMQGEDFKSLDRELKGYKRAVDHYLPFHKTSIVREYVEAIGIALVLALIIRTFIIQAFKIPSGSMIPTLLVGDHIVVNKFIYGVPVPFREEKIFKFKDPQRGDIIVFKYPRDKTKDFIKRVVAIPGDTVRIEGHRVWINGKQLPLESDGDYEYKSVDKQNIKAQLYSESLGEVSHPILVENTTPGYVQGIPPALLSITVPEDKYFMMGDNRDRSNDSRVWGMVDRSLIKGKAMVIYFSWPAKQLLRFGKLVR